MNVIHKMDNLFSEMTDSEKKVYEVVKKDPAAVIQYTIRQIAMMAGTSVSAVQRFARILGYSGYKEFRYAVISWQKEYRSTADEDTVSSLAHSFSESILNLAKTDRALLEHLCSDICTSDKIILFGRHRNKTIIEKLAMNLTDLGYTCVCVNDAIGYQHILYIINGNTCAVIFSALGETDDIRDFLLQLQSATDKRWLITFNDNPKMKKFVRHTVKLPALYTGMSYPLSSQFIMMAFAEILTMYLAEKSAEK